VQSDVTKASIASTICRKGWTATVRAPEADAGKVKKAALLAYGDPTSVSRTTELDHFVPLELGGANDMRNLWPEPSDEPPQVIDGCSDVLVEFLADRGRAARSAVGLAELPIGIAVEIEAVVQIRTYPARRRPSTKIATRRATSPGPSPVTGRHSSATARRTSAAPTSPRTPVER
jgi:hypothetical protein